MAINEVITYLQSTIINTDSVIKALQETNEEIEAMRAYAEREQNYKKVLNHALYLMSKKPLYVFGGESETGTDCSGFMQQIFAQAGINLPRVSANQINTGTNIPIGQEQAGDLVGFDLSDRNGTGIEHIGMCIGNGLMIHIANSVDRICVVDYKSKYGSKFVKATRIL